MEIGPIARRHLREGKRTRVHTFRRPLATVLALARDLERKYRRDWAPRLEVVQAQHQVAKLIPPSHPHADFELYATLRIPRGARPPGDLAWARMEAWMDGWLAAWGSAAPARDALAKYLAGDECTNTPDGSPDAPQSAHQDCLACEAARALFQATFADAGPHVIDPTE